MRTAEIKNDADFAAAVAGGAKFVLFHSAWCPFCLAFVPAFDKLAAEGGAGFLKASVDDLPAAEEEHAIEVVPTVLHFTGGRPAARLDGELGRGLSEKQLRDFVRRCLEGKGHEKDRR